MKSVYSNILDASSGFYQDAIRMSEGGDTQTYLLTAPWVDQEYHYHYEGVWAFLKPGCPITFVREKDGEADFEHYVEDFKEDLGHIVSKYNFSEILGRPREWKNLFREIEGDHTDFATYLRDNQITGIDARKVEVMISLLIGSINQAKSISLKEPENLLERIKNKVILFDTDQTRFLYEEPSEEERIIRIQGLAGTGKTELLLHKLKDKYINNPDDIIGFTCHNRVLADVMKQRIISFFNDMRVSRQIESEKLKCFHAWGSYNNPESGALSYVCHFYDVPFYALREVGNFNNACERTIHNVRQSERFLRGDKAFSYLFIDESQDFPDSFFLLCDMVTEKRVYTAGDIFQNIFTISKQDLSKAVNIILNRCYRTDPRTFMFAHGMGMGLFERNKNSWLSDEDWQKCGYQIEKLDNGKKYKLSRLPVKRFEDIPDDFKSTQVYVIKNYMIPLIRVIEEWRKSFPTLKPDDIGIIMIDEQSYIYDEATKIAEYLNRKYNWECNLAFMTKKRIPGTVFISNRNNVKGLEFPFVVCLTHEIKETLHYRHTLYTMLSRSHLQTILIVGKMEKQLFTGIRAAGNEIMNSGTVTVDVPTEKELERIDSLEFKTQKLQLSLGERVDRICQEFGVEQDSRDLIKKFVLKGKDKDSLTEDQLRSKIKELWGML